MNWQEIAGSWTQIRGKVREQWGKLTDDDLDVIAGRHDQLVGTIQQRYGMLREDAEHAVVQWLERIELDPATDVLRRGP